MTASHRFDDPQHFTAGTVGPKGQRTFYIQFGSPGEIVTLKAEKQQVSALADFLDHLLDDIEEIANDDIPLALDLVEPVNPEWVVASIGVAYRDDDGRFVLVVEELPDPDEDPVADEHEPASAQLSVTPGQVKAFVERARDLMTAGRPLCDFCGRALEGDGLWCACHN